MLNSEIKTVAIANRGEVATRIIRACQELGLKTVLLHSSADIATRAYRLADKKICIGGSSSADSYLNIEANIQGAKAGGADALHPGFGFLSENSNFAQRCLDAGIIFIGPTPQAMNLLGDKMNCKVLAKKLGLPLIPGFEEDQQDVSFLIKKCEEIGFPVIVKAAAGGGGRGMKVIRSSSEAKELIESAQREAQSAFGSSKVFLEKYLDRAKHIEFQIFGDCTGKVVHLFERECSVQRRHQKIIEEALSPSINSETRRKMGECAVSLAQAAKYTGAGTVEFLIQDNNFYLLEVNTRLQVEHPVTELVVGVDLVKAQILTAMNKPAFDENLPMTPRGHSIECRIYAENSYLGGVPSTGLLGQVFWPEGPGRRFEYGFEKDDEVTSFYDSMIAKVIVWDENRIRAIQKMKRVLADSVIFGVHTNIPYLQEILSHPDFIDGTFTTRFIDKFFPNGLEKNNPSEKEAFILEKLKVTVTKNDQTEATSKMQASPWFHNWS